MALSLLKYVLKILITELALYRLDGRDVFVSKISPSNKTWYLTGYVILSFFEENKGINVAFILPILHLSPGS